MKKGFKIIVVVLLAFVAIILLFSKYKKHENLPYKAIAVSVEIQKTPADVFAYLGNSDNAKDWSSYVNHIQVLNGDEFEDGSPGSTRRCYKNEDQSGIVWDEDIIEVEENSRRQLSLYNAKGFPIFAEGLYTEQIYTPVGDSATILTFTLFYKSEPVLIELFKMHLVSYRVHSIFEKNLEKIKQIVENGKP
jgi:uncharacterized membrane protein